MNKFLLPAIVIVASLANAANAQSTAKTTKKEATKPETPVLHQDEYRQKLDEVIVIGQDPYWRKGGTPRWDRPKVDVDAKLDEPNRQLFPKYTAEEADEAMKPHDSNRNNGAPKIKIFEKKL